jgi:hypothetical protein
MGDGPTDEGRHGLIGRRCLCAGERHLQWFLGREGACDWWWAWEPIGLDLSVDLEGAGRRELRLASAMKVVLLCAITRIQLPSSSLYIDNWGTTGPARPLYV